ncbi:MAG: hypothetical protein ACHREM_29845, partial [Polyangiales bacterium]
LQEQRVRAWTKRLPDAITAASFMPVRVKEDARATVTSDSGVEVILRGGRVVRVGVDFDADLLRRVVAALEDGASC